MANNFFRFKQFTVHQENCAMKVCTDSCLLGAIAAGQIENEILKSESILDIGAGTGLLSLMLAQKSNATIDAVEINDSAFDQMEENFKNSPWSKYLHPIYADILDFHPDKKYDLIISNPPFFENDLKGKDQHRSVAMHDEGLKLAQLVHEIKRLINPEGTFIILTAHSRMEDLKYFLEKAGAYIHEEIAVRQTPVHEVFRNIVIGTFYKKPEKVLLKEIVIKEGDVYSADFTDLLKDYYEKL